MYRLCLNNGHCRVVPVRPIDQVRDMPSSSRDLVDRPNVRGRDYSLSLGFGARLVRGLIDIETKSGVDTFESGPNLIRPLYQLFNRHGRSGLLQRLGSAMKSGEGLLAFCSTQLRTQFFESVMENLLEIQ